MSQKMWLFGLWGLVMWLGGMFSFSLHALLDCLNFIGITVCITFMIKRKKKDILLLCGQGLKERKPGPLCAFSETRWEGDGSAIPLCDVTLRGGCGRKSVQE